MEDPTHYYLDCFRFFHQQLPNQLRNHRAYFVLKRRGFGEDAFHVMWFFLFREFKPKSFLEIGVYRGQTTSLAALLSRNAECECEVFGISPFSPAGDSVSNYLKGIDYYTDTQRNFEHFKLPQAQLLRAYSTAPEAHTLIKSRKWDMIYIDGNHDFQVARQDFEICSQNLAVGGIIVLDDSGLTTSFRPPSFSTAGHPGPSRLAKEIDRSRFRELLQVGHNRVFQRIV